MKNISLKIGVTADLQTTLTALNTLEGLSNWWTNDVTGSTNQGETIKFRFNGHGPDMKVITNAEDMITWQCIAGIDEWVGTEITFEIKDEGETTIYFQHKNWKEETPFHFHCSMKWATFMLSLKQYLEEGLGRPFPNDIQITNKGN